MAVVRDIDAFRKAVEAGEEIEDARVSKDYPAIIKAEGGERELAFIVSTGSIDRHNETVAANGWELDGFRKAGVVLWAHQATELPIAKPTFADVKGGALKARAVFASRDLNPLADTVYRMLLEGYLKNVSAGFRPLEWVYNEQRGGVDFKRQELLEFSVVPIGANSESMLAAKDAGIELAPLREWAQKTLDGLEGPGIWLPKDVAAQALKIASGSPVSVAVPDAAGAGPSGSHAPASPGATPGAATKLEVTLDAAGVLEEVRKEIDGIVKAGRVLSQANESRLRGALDSISGAVSSIGEVLSQMKQDEDGAGKAVPVTTAPVEPVRKTHRPITREQLRAVVAKTMAEKIAWAKGRLPD